MIATFLLPNISPMVLLLGIAVLIVLIFVLILWVLWRTKTKQEAPAQDAQAMAGEEADSQQAGAEPKPALVKASEPQVTSSVASAVRFVRENTAGAGGRYRTPWFLVVGASGSGKSTLLDHSGISLSLREGATDFGVAQGIRWRFFDGGVVLDVPGDFFLRADHTASDEHNWKALLRNLTMRRPQRPIDGIVLTIPCTELFGHTAIAPVMMGQRASHIFDKLWQLQKWLGMCVPVYVVITKCDALPGFKSLARQLPAHNRREMFGWSNPYNVEAAFEPGWVDQGFEELVRQVNRLQCEVLVERRNIEDADDLFLFSGKLLELRRPLRIYLGQIFKHAAYRESLQFRGFYFCGDASELIEAVPEPAPAQAMAAAASYSGATSGFAAPEYPAITGEVLGLTPVTKETPEAAPIFVTDLFESKIFPERGLARPVGKVRLSKNRWMIGAQAACIALVIVLSIGMFINYRRLNDTQKAFVTILEKLAPILDRTQKARASRSEAQLTARERDIADQLLQTVQSAPGYRFKTIFYPTSLTHPLDDRLEDAMVPIFNNLVLPSFRQQLLEKGRNLLRSGASPESCNKTPAYMGDLASYRELCGFSTDLRRLERNIEGYNRLTEESVGGVPSTQDLKDLNELERYLNKHPLPNDFDRNPYFQKAFARSRGDKILPQHLDTEGDAEPEFKALTSAFFKQWFTENSALAHLDELKGRVDELDQPQRYDRLDSTQKLLAQVKGELASAEFAWMGNSAFELTPPMEEVTNQVIDASGLFFSGDQQNRLKNFVHNTGVEQFNIFTKKRDSETSGFIGDLLSHNNGTIQLSDNADKLRLYLEKLLKQPFAQKDSARDIQTKVPAGSELRWDKDLLQQAAVLPDQYNGFIKDALADLPTPLHEPFTSIALDRLEAGLVSLVAQAQTIQPLPLSQDPEVFIVPELQNFQDAAGQLESLLGHMHELQLRTTEDELRNATVSQAANLLRRIDLSYEQQAPYSASGGNFNRWNGENTPEWAAFGARNKDEVAQYVLFQHQQAQQYAGKAAPVIDFLMRVSTDERLMGGLETKWQGIVSDLQNYAKDPGTSLKGLEQFIGAEVPKTTPDNCQAEYLTTAVTGNNYFAGRQEWLRGSLRRRCLVLSQHNAVIKYEQIAKFFNENLSGKFPFSGPPRETLPSEADPQDIVKLYGFVDTSEKSIRAGLQKGDFGSSYSQVLDFLKRLDDLRPVFGSLLAGQPDPVPTLDIVPAFRVNQGREINGNQIIDWTLQVGDETFRYRDPERAGRWNFGDPVKLVLRWAKDSPQQPVTARQAVDGKLNNRTATFEYRDSWSLFTLLALHRPAASDFSRMVDPDPQTLVFAVNASKSSDPASTSNQPNPEAKVFVRIRLRAPGKPDNLRLQPFPIAAPELEQTQIQAGAGGNN